MPQAAAISQEQFRMLAMILIPLSCIPAYIAKKKGRSFFLWYIYAYGFFILALIHSLLIMPRPSREERTVAPPQYTVQSEFIINKRRINYCFIGCPMDTLSYVILGYPQARRLVVKLNLFAEKPIKAFDIHLELCDTMNRKITDKVFNNIAYSENVEFDISEYPYTMYVNFIVDRIYMENGEEWVKHGEPVEYNIDVLDGYELEKLKNLTNKYAICLPHEEEDYWVCSCSKANNTDSCVLCGISRKELFEKVDKGTVLELKNDLIRRNNLSKFNIAVSERQI